MGSGINVNPVQTSINAKSSASFGGSSVRYNDPNGDAALGVHTASGAGSARIVVGEVLWSGGKTYDCRVRVGGLTVGCAVAQPCMSTCSGYSLGAVPPPGSKVVVMMLGGVGSPRGIVIGVIPMGFFHNPGSAKMSERAMFGDGDEFDEVPSDSLAALKTIPDGKKDSGRLASSSERPADMVPGDVSLVNEHGCGLYGSLFSATLMGGGAYVRACRIDDELRLRSTNMTVWTDSFAEEHYNDCGYCSGERREYSFYGERIGKEGVKGVPEPGMYVPRPRVVEYSGFLGGVRSTFVSRPGSGSLAPLGDGDSPVVTEGVYSSSIGQSGEVLIRSAGGIAIERYDRIPVPSRSKKPWDSDLGDNASEVKIRPFKPFSHGGDGNRALELYDSVAWTAARQYSRFDDFKKDFFTPEERDIDPPEDDERDPQGSKSDFEGCRGRRAGVYIESNGSIVIRDAWGSEIHMGMGDIYMSCRGSVHVMTGKSVVAMAGESAVVKAVRGVAELSSAKAVNIASPDHVSIMGGSDQKEMRGGVIIEAKGRGTSRNLKVDKVYDDGRVSGIVLKSEGKIAMGSDEMDLAAKSRFTLVTGDSGNERSGEVEIATGEFTAVADESKLVSKDAVVSATRSGVEIASKGSAVFAGGSTEIYTGNMLATLLGPALKEDPKKEILDRAKDVYDSLQKKTDKDPYSYGYFDKYVYALPGTSEDYMCEDGMSLNRDDRSVFYILTPMWKWTGFTKGMEADGWEVPDESKEVEVFKNEKRNKFNDRFLWPGNKSVEGGFSVGLGGKSGGGNVDAGEGCSMPRKDLVDHLDVEFRKLSEFKL